jgi:predicted ATP-dependent endonuclease of OLD family
MKLESFRIQNFRSLFDSGIVRVDEITTLIGPNESGKSSLLQGLASISMDEMCGDFDLTQLEGVAKKYMDGDLKGSDIEIVWAKFILDPQDKEELASIIREPEQEQSQGESAAAEGESQKSGETAILSNAPAFTAPDYLEIRKHYDGFYKLFLNGSEIRFPSRTAIESAKEKIRKELEYLSSEANSKFLTRSPNNQFKPQFDEALKSLSKVKITRQEDGQPLMGTLEEINKLAFDEEFHKLIKSATSRIKRIVESSFPSSDMGVRAYEYILRRMPKTVYFRIYERMEDEVLIEELKEKPHKHKTFLNFLTLAEINLDTVQRLIDDSENSKIPVYLENGCGKATKLLREAWKQEVLDVELRYLDGRLLVFTKNSKAVETLLPPSSGSEGFQWYFGFYINFGAATKAEYKNAILLLDDPGVFLHPTGHRELLDLFEKYREDNIMTIYATHLPFLIPRDKLLRLRLIEKEGARSKVSEKFWAISDKDVLYPVRAALGVTLADSLYVGAMTIIAEGPSDGILLNGMLELLRRHGVRKIRPSLDVQLLSAKGASKAKEHAILLEIERLPYVLVLDNDHEGQITKKEAIEEGIPESNILLLPSFPGIAPEEYDLEDLFPLEIYAKAFHNVSGNVLKLTYEDVLKRLGDGKEKISNRAKQLLKEVNYDLDKIAVAREILKVSAEPPQLDKTLEQRFCQLFDDVNKRIHLYQ